MNNMTMFDIGTFEGFDAQIGVVEDVDTFKVAFFYCDRLLELPEGYMGRLEYEHIDTLVLTVPKTLYSWNGEPFDPKDYFHGLHIDANNGGSHKLHAVAAKLFIWSRWGRKGLVPDPVLESAEDFGRLVEKLAELQNFIYSK